VAENAVACPTLDHLLHLRSHTKAVHTALKPSPIRV
jgi:hypothetical protein